MNKNGYKVRYVDVHTKDGDTEGTLASATARSITLDLNARPCDDLAPLRHMLEERKRETKAASHPSNSCAIALLLLGCMSTGIHCVNEPLPSLDTMIAYTYTHTMGMHCYTCGKTL